MDQKILEYIEAHREEMVSTLMSLIEELIPDEMFLKGFEQITVLFR